MFKDRFEAGERLAKRLQGESLPRKLKDVVILGIPRGGIAIGKKISQVLNIPLDCLIIKKIPAPENEELAIGAVGEGGVVVWEEELVRRLQVPLEYRQKIVKQKLTEFEKKENDFRSGRPIPEIQGRTVIITDDGIATGATIKAAIKIVRSFSPKEMIVAVPVIALEGLPEVKKIADRVIYLETPEVFFSVDQFYQDFSQPSDEEIRKILRN